jgi:hypothetical protein
MACVKNCVCPRCLEHLFRDNDQLAATYLKTRKLIEQREKNWILQDKEREIRREEKRREADDLLFRIDLEMKRRTSSNSNDYNSITNTNNPNIPTYSI